MLVDEDLVEKVRTALGRVSGLQDTEIVILGDRISQSKSVLHVRLLLSSPKNHRLIMHQFPSDFKSSGSLPIFDLSQGDNRNHTAFVCFSSGTSGKPKGVELTHYSLIASLAGIRASDPAFYNSENRGGFFAPLCHVYGLTLALLYMVRHVDNGK
jgi:long-subunit acyl-CoA synthetase (AMP-forming)